MSILPYCPRNQYGFITHRRGNRAKGYRATILSLSIQVMNSPKNNSLCAIFFS